MAFKTKRLLLGFVVLVLVVATILFLIPTPRLIIVGYLRQEPFHKGRPVGFWIHALGSEDADGPMFQNPGGKIIFDAKTNALIALAEMGPEAKDAIPALVATLQSKHEGWRVRAAVALGKIGPEASSAITAILQATALGQERLHSSSPIAGEWIAYAESLAALAPESIPAATRALHDKHAATRFISAYTLALLGPNAKEVMPDLIAALKDPSIRDSARHSLGGLTLYDDAPPSAKSVEFFQIAIALGEIGPAAREAVPVILDAIRDGVEPIIYTFRNVTDLQPLAALKKIEPDFEPMVDAIARFKGQPEQIVTRASTCLDALGNKDKHVRELAAYYLGVHGYFVPPNLMPIEPVVAALTKALRDESKGMRWSAATALLRVPLPRDAIVQREAVYRLALPVLLDAVAQANQHRRVRYWALHNLREISRHEERDLRKLVADPGAVADVLMSAFKDPDPNVQREALFALEHFSTRPEHTQAMVAKSIAYLKSKRFTPTDWKVTQLLGRMGSRATEVVPLLREIIANWPADDPQKKLLEDVLKKIDPKAKAKG